MAVPEQTPYKEYEGNGVTKSFALGFICESKDHLIVLVDEIEPPIATWSLSGGNVVFTTAPASGSKITLQRNTPFGRTTDYQSFNNSFRPQAVNGDFDRLWLKLQELGVADWLMKLYVDRLHQQQEAKINDLKSYVDDRDDELQSYLMEEIRKQGVALDQLDEYYNYLMQRLAQIAEDKGWDASFVVDGPQTQKEINLYGGKKYDMPFGGYDVGQIVVLDNGYRVESIEPNNINNPNIDMDGWERVNYSYKQISVKDFFTREQLRDCLTATPQLKYSDAFQAAVDAAIANGSHSIFVPFDQGEVYVLDKTVNLNCSGFEIRGNRAPTYFRNTGQIIRGYICADENVVDFFNYNNGAGSGIYSSNQIVVDGIGKIGKVVNGVRTQNFLKMDTDNNGPHRGVLFTKSCGIEFNEILSITTRTSSYMGAGSVVFENGCVYNRNNAVSKAYSRSFNLRVAGIQSEQGAKWQGRFDGGITFVDNMLEGQTTPIDIQTNGGTIDIHNNYFEAHTGEAIVKFSGTTAAATFNHRNNYYAHTDNVIDIMQLSGILSVNSSGIYNSIGNRVSQLTFKSLYLAVNSIINSGRAYTDTTSGTQLRGYCSTEGIPVDSEAVCTSAIGTTPIQTPIGLNKLAHVVTGTSAYIPLSLPFESGDSVTVCALVKLKGGDSPIMRLYNESTLITSLSQLPILSNNDGRWQIAIISTIPSVSGTQCRINFTSTEGLVVAAVGVKVIPKAKFQEFSSTFGEQTISEKRAPITIFNPLYNENVLRSYLVEKNVTLPSISNGLYYDLSTTTVRGAEVGDPVYVGLNVDDQGLDIRGRVSSASTVSIRIHNRTAAPVNLGEVALKIKVLK
ncbi:hypothetical protein [Acinetobacter sp. Ver3]|uniref:hypothetical protein n=1 Tax=Acinetobacter sp. Ver3 TaxID=466088 RepID=UPI00044A7C9A|nr:hypothetical protein [Acinetobacter sp. Ver3]EZQ12162.1 hypothetical protein CL42_01935 [Acinetobacter sp. Ver3]